MAARKKSGLGKSPWTTAKKMSPITTKNGTPQQNKGAYEPSGKGYPKKQKPGGGTPSKGR